jgi:glycosyltransferase involved in cell wall biosynthesis
MTPTDPGNKKIALAANAAWNIVNFRLGLARGLMAAGYEVIAIAPPDEHVPRIEAAGVRFVPMPMNRKGTNPIEDIGLLWRLYTTLRRERPAVYLGFTIKPNVYGGLACRWLGIASIHNIAGLGFAFGSETLLTRVARQLYSWGLGEALTVFFQNDDDRELLVRQGVVKQDATRRLPGSGVDTERFALQSAPPRAGRAFRVLLCARLLRDKGIAEYAQAARLLHQSGCDIEFRLLGFFDHDNPGAIQPAEIETWEAQGLLRHLGSADDVRPHLAAVDAVALPSYYREGLPRTLLEAASMGKPIVTTDSVGCREAVVDGVTGLLCRPRDPVDLARKLRQLVELPPDELAAMGRRARERAVRDFDEHIVVDRYIDAIGELDLPTDRRG